MKLTKLGAKVHLTTTDPANHLNYDFAIKSGITVSHIDEAEVLEKYKNEVRSKAAETMTAEDMEYIEEDLHSPCTQEIAVFKAFAEIVDKAENEIVVIDTAPTGHTFVAFGCYPKLSQRSRTYTGRSNRSSSQFITPFTQSTGNGSSNSHFTRSNTCFEAERLQMDLQRAGINNKWWVVNACLSLTNTANSFCKQSAK